MLIVMIIKKLLNLRLIQGEILYLSFCKESNLKYSQGQTQINIPKAKSPHTVESLVSILPEFSCAHKVKYLFTHKLFF